MVGLKFNSNQMETLLLLNVAGDTQESCRLHQEKSRSEHACCKKGRNS